MSEKPGRAELRAVFPVVVPVALWAFVAALLETAALTAIAFAATTAASGETETTLDIRVWQPTITPGRLLIVAVGAILVAGVVGVWSARVQARAVSQWEAERRTQLAQSFLSADWDALAAHDPGRLVDTAGMTVSRATGVIGNLATLLRALTSVAVLVVGAFLLDPATSGLLVALGVFLFAVLRPLTAMVRRASRESVDSLGDHAARLAHTSELAQELRVFGAEPAFAARLQAAIDRRRRAHSRTVQLTTSVPILYSTLGLLVIVAALGVLVASDLEELGGFGAAALLLLRSLSYGQSAQGAVQRLAESGAYLQRFNAEVAAFGEPRSTSGAVPLDRIETVDLRDVSYTYPDARTDALRSVSTTLRHGERIGLVGPSGSGKSTLASILLRLREPGAGTMRVNGRAANEFTQSSWVNNVALVPQRPNLLNGTVEENVRFFRSEVSTAEVRHALELAGLTDLIAELPEGLHTRVGREDRQLSGGQLQRLAIARALAGRPSMLVLDEPTSALDEQAEQVVADTVANLTGRCLVVVIAHRPATLAACDRVLTLRDGELVEDRWVAQHHRAGADPRPQQA